MSPRAGDTVFLSVISVAVLLVGFAVGWESHRYKDATERCYSDEPCPFGPGIVGSRECHGGRLAEKCEAPERPPWREPNPTDIEVMQGIVREEMRRSPVNHVHLTNGECHGQGCEVPEDSPSLCGEPPVPPASWADGGYEKMLAEHEAGAPL